eukprot:gene43879-54524_t
MTLMAGPIDTRISPTKVNELAMGKPISWFEQNLIHRVPLRYPGATRRVYPGFIQLTAFMSMNADRHMKAQVDLYKHLAKGETEQANTIKTFYDEYFAVLDMAAEFYLETVQWVFQEHRLPKGELEYKGRRVNPKAIRRTALFTIEGERDDISGIGQTKAALKIAVDMAEEGLITREEAVARVDPAALDQLLHPTLDPSITRDVIETGLPASPGAAIGKVSPIRPPQSCTTSTMLRRSSASTTVRSPAGVSKRTVRPSTST